MTSPQPLALEVPADVAVSPELHAPVSTGVEVCYQTYGEPTDEPLVLIMGLGAPMTWWDDRLCRLLAAQGFHVIRFDNRDCGRSGSCEGRVSRADLVRAYLGLSRRAPYTVEDMADDVAALLDHLEIPKAHVVGASMGGMIAQTLTIRHQQRVSSLVSIMSTTGRRSVGWQHPSLLPRLLAPRARTLEEYIPQALQMGQMIGSPAYPEDDAEARDRARTTWQRGINAAGTLRQMLAILTQRDRSADLHSVHVPAAVIHGSKDKMVHVSGGRATAAAIPGAELVVVDGMGHDLPLALYPIFLDVIRRTADRASA